LLDLPVFFLAQTVFTNQIRSDGWRSGCGHGEVLFSHVAKRMNRVLIQRIAPVTNVTVNCDRLN
jgi:hypothetical protein